MRKETFWRIIKQPWLFTQGKTITINGDIDENCLTLLYFYRSNWYPVILSDREISRAKDYPEPRLSDGYVDYGMRLKLIDDIFPDKTLNERCLLLFGEPINHTNLALWEMALEIEEKINGKAKD